MSKQQLIEALISDAPDDKLDIILAFVRSVLYDGAEIIDPLLSESSLAKDWLTVEEDLAWKDL